jgi:hypothetical protein
MENERDSMFKQMKKFVVSRNAKNLSGSSNPKIHGGMQCFK